MLPRIEVMPPPANRLIELLAATFPSFAATHPLPAHVRQALRMVTACHTAALGGHVERCPDGHLERLFYNSCGHRFCPRCAGRMRRNWLRDRQAKLLPVRHYHVVFTAPHAFTALWRRNPQVLGDLLFHAATGALRALLADPRWLGAEPGMTVTLETWDDRLRFHPHLHVLVTGGGLTPAGEWRDAPNPRCLVAVTPLMWEFRKRFCQELNQAVQDAMLTLPEGTTARQWRNRLNRVNRQRWEVFIARPPEDGGPTTGAILRYQAADVAGGPLSGERLVAAPADRSAAQLAYLKAAPLSAQRIDAVADGQVSFWWGAYDPITGRRDRTQRETLPVAEFLERYLQHIPPPHYQTVRHYGLYTSVRRDALTHCRARLADRPPPGIAGVPVPAPDEDTDAWRQAHTCPVCGQPLLVSAYLPSSGTDRVHPRVPLGPVSVRPPPPGGVHAP